MEIGKKVLFMAKELIFLVQDKFMTECSKKELEMGKEFTTMIMGLPITMVSGKTIKSMVMGY
jgi:hypothetical protein